VVCQETKTVSQSSTEAEYKAMTDVTAELMWVQSVLQELRILHSRSARLWCDNMGAKYLLSNPIFHGRMRDVEVDYIILSEIV
jgi:hypothetical protein